MIGLTSTCLVVPRAGAGRCRALLAQHAEQSLGLSGKDRRKPNEQQAAGEDDTLLQQQAVASGLRGAGGRPTLCGRVARTRRLSMWTVATEPASTSPPPSTCPAPQLPSTEAREPSGDGRR